MAFNVYLDGNRRGRRQGDRVGDAKSNGGLPAVRAIGFAVPERGGIVTVSMNLVDHEVTGLGVAFDEVTRLATDQGMSVTDSEIVGLVPASALGPDDIDHLQLVGFDLDRQVLERLVDAAEEGTQP